jgi:hypothetical protein
LEAAAPRVGWVVAIVSLLALAAAVAGLVVDGINLLFPLLAVAVAIGLPPFASEILHRRVRAPTPRVYDTAEFWSTDPRVDESTPVAQLYLPGSFLLAWLIKHDQLKEWAEDALDKPLADVRSGALHPRDLYRQMDGILASDLCRPMGREFLNWLTSDNMGAPIAELVESWGAQQGPSGIDDSHDMVAEAVADLDALYNGTYRRLFFTQVRTLN